MHRHETGTDVSCQCRLPGLRRNRRGAGAVGSHGLARPGRRQRGHRCRFDLHATPVWRADFARTYVEGGVGLHLLSHTINNDATHMSTSFEFGSHVGAGLRIGERRDIRVGIALQHLSNAGIKEPNSGLNFLLVNASFPL
jgi:hypothetical protein